MKRLPKEYVRQLQPGLKVIWFGRRAAAEVVAEVSEAIFKMWVWLGIIWWYSRMTTAGYESTGRVGYAVSGGVPSSSDIGFIVGVVIVCLLLSRKAIFEILNWRYEVYIVTHDETNGSGRVDKFSGWLRKSHISEAITPSSPTMIFDQDWPYRLWGLLTGEQMARITLRSVTHTFIEGRKISPRMERAIAAVRGMPKVKAEFSPTDLTRFNELKQAAIDGLISWDEARRAANVILARSVYGD